MRRRGFTLVEIMIATALAAVMSAFLLMITRTQIAAYQTNDELVATQQNVRASLDFIGTYLRRACAGLSTGRVTWRNGATRSSAAGGDACVKFYDGYKVDKNAASFSSSGADATKYPDAIEVIGGMSPVTSLTQIDGAATCTALPTASISVANVTGFAAGDWILVTDYSQGFLAKINTITTSSKTLNLATSPNNTIPAAVPTGMTLSATSCTGSGTTPALAVMKAVNFSLFVTNTNNASNFSTAEQDQLWYDPDGMAGVDHTGAQPIADGVIDLQLAIGLDSTNTGLPVDSGTATDDWLGNNSGDGALPSLPWNSGTPSSANKWLMSIRATLIGETINQIAGAPAIPPQSEDRTTLYSSVGGSAVTLSTSSASGPRLRQMRALVAPRQWLANSATQD